jgi:hypothetical protein
VEEFKERDSPQESGLSGFIRAAGVILAISYPVLALSTGVRALYQLFFKEGVDDYLPPLLSGLAALLYLTALVGLPHWLAQFYPPRADRPHRLAALWRRLRLLSTYPATARIGLAPPPRNAPRLQLVNITTMIDRNA